MKRLLPYLLLFSACITFLVLFIKQLPPKEVKTPPTPIEYPIKGFQVSPKSYSVVDYPEFFERNKALKGTSIGWTGSVSDLAKPFSAPVAIVTTAEEYRYIPVLTVQSYDRATGKLLPDFIDGKAKIMQFIAEFKPEFFGMGIEINMQAYKNPQEYQKFLALFNEYTDEIHKVSKSTQVFTTFQYEQLLGLKGGLFGGVNDETKATWQLLKDFEKADILGITTYPTLVYENPSQIPTNYYSQLFEQTQKKIIFTEMGWLSENGISGWNGSQTEQIAFLTKLRAQTNNTNTLGYLWSFMYKQQAAPSPFLYMSLVDENGKSSEVETFWKNMLSK